MRYVISIFQVFDHLFRLQLEEDVNEVIFALCSESSVKEDCFTEAACQLEKLLKFKHPEISQNVKDTTKKIRCLKWVISYIFLIENFVPVLFVGVQAFSYFVEQNINKLGHQLQRRNTYMTKGTACAFAEFVKG